MSTGNEKLVVIGTCGLDDPEKATLPFVAANTALAMDVPAVVILQGDAVTVARKGAADGVEVPGFPPLRELLKNLFEMGGELLLCTPCVESRGIPKEELLDGAVLIKAGRVLSEVMEAKNVLTY
ncbi:MAG: sulfur reduction protein DsrE [Deltaproteobacteria bacterium]|nr:MAG: sulfur reduction protein DsrE [Deltaproteobacteria bacterium]